MVPSTLRSTRIDGAGKVTVVLLHPVISGIYLYGFFFANPAAGSPSSKHRPPFPDFEEYRILLGFHRG
jgi:hypothetical protein